MCYEPFKYPCKVSKKWAYHTGNSDSQLEGLSTVGGLLELTVHDQGQEGTIGRGVNDAFQVFITVQKPQ